MSLRVGVCCRPEEAGGFLGVGFDYVETGAVLLLEGARGVPGVEATNLFFQGKDCLYDPGFDAAGYARRVIGLAQAEGAEVMVIGSAGSRRSTAEVGVAEAEGRFVELVGRLQREVAGPMGMVLAPEALNKGECDVWNSTSGLAAALASVGVGYTFDTYHFFLEEGAESVWPATMPVHVHVSSRGRGLPEAGDGEVAEVFDWLRAGGYSGRMSFEGRLEEGEMAVAADRLRGFWG